MDNQRPVIRFFKIAVLVMLILLAVYSVFSAGKAAVSGSVDFQYDGAKYIAMGEDPYAETLNPTGKQKEYGLFTFYENLEANQFPSMLMFLIPFTVFSPQTANCLWLVCNLFFSVGILFFVKKLFLPKDMSGAAFIVFSCLLFISSCWKNQIAVGQHTVFSLFFFLAAIYFSEKNNRIFSGVLLAVSLFKYTLTAPLMLWFVYKRKYREIVYAAAIHGVLTLVAAWKLGVPLIDLIALPLKISSMLSSSGSYDVASVFGLGSFGMIVSGLLFTVVFFISLFVKFDGMEKEAFSVLCMFSLVFVYHRAYDFFVMIIPLAVFVFNKNNGKNVIDILRKVSVSLCSAYPFLFYTAAERLFDKNILNIFDTVFALFFYVSVIFLFCGIQKTPKFPKGDRHIRLRS